MSSDSGSESGSGSGSEPGMETVSDWQVPLPDGYDDTNKAFLQAFMARGTLTLKEARPILAAILNATGRASGGEEVHPESITKDDFEGYVSMAREAVSPLDFDIRSAVHQVSKERVWAFVNTNSDPATQLATTHSPEEVAFIKRLLDAMFETYNTRRMEVMCVTEQQALKVARPPRGGARESNGAGRNGAADEEGEPATQQLTDKGLKHSEVLALLPGLVAEGWLEKSRHGFYSLTPRALLELWGWLNASYNDPDADGGDWQRIKFCEACKEIVTVGQRCAEVRCNVRLHDICEESFWRTREDKKCPRCETKWDGKHYVGERAVTQTKMYAERRRGGGRASDAVDAVIQQQNAPQDGEESDEE